MRLPGWLWPFRRRAPGGSAALGRWGEAQAVRELKRRGYRIRARNVRLRGGELDIVAEHGGATVFVEVKTRRDNAFGGARQAVTPAKARRLARLAQAYRQRHPHAAGACRIDVAAVQVDADGGCSVEIIPNAVQT